MNGCPLLNSVLLEYLPYYCHVSNWIVFLQWFTIHLRLGYMYICVHVHKHVCVPIFACMCMCVCVSVCVHVCVWIKVRWIHYINKQQGSRDVTQVLLISFCLRLCIFHPKTWKTNQQRCIPQTTCRWKWNTSWHQREHLVACTIVSPPAKTLRVFNYINRIKISSKIKKIVEVMGAE